MQVRCNRDAGEMQGRCTYLPKAVGDRQRALELLGDGDHGRVRPRARDEGADVAAPHEEHVFAHRIVAKFHLHVAVVLGQEWQE